MRSSLPASDAGSAASAGLPASPVSTTSVVGLVKISLGTGIGLLPFAFRLAAGADAGSRAPDNDDELDEEEDGAWGMA